jgi:hypothetical protein
MMAAKARKTLVSKFHAAGGNEHARHGEGKNYYVHKAGGACVELVISLTAWPSMKKDFHVR